MARAHIDAERLRALLSYDPATGAFRWRVSRKTVAGDSAGYICPAGYRMIRADGRKYAAHRLAWLYVHGALPKDQVDHIDGDRANNSLSNLRECFQYENMQNQSLHRNNTSGRPGVSWNKVSKKWSAGISLHGKRKNLGLFDDVDSAAQAYVRAKAQVHKFNPLVRAA